MEHGVAVKRVTDVDREHVALVRRFNRDYTRLVGVLDEHHLRSEFSLTEVRVLYELAHAHAPTASDLQASLGLDAGYLSRLLARLVRRRIVRRTRSESDGRERHLSLTAEGRAEFKSLDRQASREIHNLIAPLGDDDRRRLVDAIETVASLLGLSSATKASAEPAYILRPPRAGDLGWIVKSQGELYAREYGWGERMEGLIARVIADFVRDYDPARDRCWIAERRGQNVGAVLVVKDTEREGVARLRLLHVDPSARGLGIGARLVDECIRFALDAGYHTITLWTHTVLDAARRIYAAKGFTIVREETHDHFGAPIQAETWDLPLRDAPTPPPGRRRA